MTDERGESLNHPLVDGNKRTGDIAGTTFLLVNGVIAADASLDDMRLGIWLERVVSRQLTFEEFVNCLRERLLAR